MTSLNLVHYLRLSIKLTDNKENRFPPSSNFVDSADKRSTIAKPLLAVCVKKIEKKIDIVGAKAS